MDIRGVETPHQYPRTFGDLQRATDFCVFAHKPQCHYLRRQYNQPSVHQKNGGNSQCTDVGNGDRHMEVSPEISHKSRDRTCSGGTESRGRSPVQTVSGGTQRDHRVETEQESVQPLSQEMGPFERDLFASHWNHQLPNYITWKDQHHTMNAFHHQWINGDYLFPPFSLIGRVLRKIRQDKCKVVLVAPKWETQPWYPTLREMLHSKPIKLWGNFRDRAGNPHPLGQALHLTAYLRTRLVQEGVSEETSHVAVNAWAPETIRKYQSSWKKWPAFSETKGKNPCANPIDINHVADFLASQSKAGITYSQIRCYISALSAILPKLHGKNLSQHDLITKVMRSPISS